jgi:hypothetical protein
LEVLFVAEQNAEQAHQEQKQRKQCEGKIKRYLGGVAKDVVVIDLFAQTLKEILVIEFHLPLVLILKLSGSAA